VVARERGTQHRRLAARRIRPGHKRQQVERGLVYEEDGALFGPGFA
jgi:hypothetical protein